MATLGPHHIDIRSWQSWQSFAVSAPTRVHSAAKLGAGILYPTSGGAVNCGVTWRVPLVAGTWDLTVVYTRESNNGIMSWLLDASSVGNIDGYGTFQNNTVGTISGITVATDAVYALTLANIFKNGSSSGYSYQLQHIALDRTGA